MGDRLCLKSALHNAIHINSLTFCKVKHSCLQQSSSSKWKMKKLLTVGRLIMNSPLSQWCSLQFPANHAPDSLASMQSSFRSCALTPGTPSTGELQPWAPDVAGGTGNATSAAPLSVMGMCAETCMSAAHYE